MARMYSRKKGKSGSTKPAKSIPSWAPYKGEEVEKLVEKYAKAGKSASEIGMILRDRYGIHSVRAVTEKKVTTVLAEKKLTQELPEDFLSLIKKMVAIKQHREKNNKDMTALRGEQLTRSKLLRLMRYYKKTGKIPQNWKLDEKRLKMYLN